MIFGGDFFIGHTVCYLKTTTDDDEHIIDHEYLEEVVEHEGGRGVANSPLLLIVNGDERAGVDQDAGTSRHQDDVIQEHIDCILAIDVSITRFSGH